MALLTPLLVLVRLVTCALERLWPRRPFRYGVFNRWAGNGGLLATNLAATSVVFPPGGTIAMAWYCTANEIGLLNRVDLPDVAAFAVGFLAVDLAMWAQHWLLHRFDFLWRAHQVHHSDLDLDFTTALRFHPFETVFTITIRMLAVAAIGAPMAAVALFEVALEALGTVDHASIRIPARVDAVLRRFLVTPDYHRVHHSAAPEMNHNYAVICTVWDRLLGTYQAQPVKGHLGMKLGLPERRESGALHYFNLLALPFRSLSRER